MKTIWAKGLQISKTVGFCGFTSGYTTCSGAHFSPGLMAAGGVTRPPGMVGVGACQSMTLRVHPRHETRDGSCGENIAPPLLETSASTIRTAIYLRSGWDGME